MSSRMLYLSIGSNLGDRQANILRAVSLLDAGLAGRHVKMSSFMQTPSWGFTGEDFLNVAVSYETALPAEEVLRICKDVERRMGRVDEGAVYDASGRRIYKNRIIEIDIVLLGEEKVDTPELKIPHPRMWEREFVIKPLKEIFNGELMQGID